MTIQRVTDLSGPPIVGERYTVPLVRYKWSHFGERLWPVFLPQHNDAEFFDFPHPHYHLDPRFVSERVFRQSRTGDFFSWPLSWRGDPQGPRLYSWASLPCLREMPPYPFITKGPVRALRAHYAMQRCAKGPNGWICPHRKTDLGSMRVDPDGTITCPLHGLRIIAKSGVVCEAARQP